jgi:hypothetical protein
MVEIAPLAVPVVFFVCYGSRMHHSRTHGHSINGKPTRTYYAWVSAKARCHNPRHRAYPRYGAAGIVVCDRWRDSFANFLSDMGEAPPALTLERIDNAKGYEPRNCRWATRADQNRNKRGVEMIDGLARKAFARKHGVRYTSLLKALRRGLSPADALAHVRRFAVKPLLPPT